MEWLPIEGLTQQNSRHCLYDLFSGLPHRIVGQPGGVADDQQTLQAGCCYVFFWCATSRVNYDANTFWHFAVAALCVIPGDLELCTIWLRGLRRELDAKTWNNMNKHHERARIPIVGNTCGITAIKACENHPARLCCSRRSPAACLSQSLWTVRTVPDICLRGGGSLCQCHQQASGPTQRWHMRPRRGRSSGARARYKANIVWSVRRLKQPWTHCNIYCNVDSLAPKKGHGKDGKVLAGFFKTTDKPNISSPRAIMAITIRKSRLQRCLQRFDLWRREHPPKDSWNLQQGQMDLAGHCHCACHLSGRAHRTCTTSPGMKTVQLVVGNSPPPKLNMNPNQLYTVVKSSALGLHFISFHDKFSGFIKLSDLGGVDGIL